MGLIKKAWVIQTVNKQEIQDSNNNCNCRHNNNSRDSEPCCRCDSKHTNADRIRNMSDEELMEFLSHIRSGHDVNYGDWVNFGHGIVLNSCDTDIESRIRDWLQSEAE